MLKTCINTLDNFKKWLSIRDPYNSHDGGYNYLSRMNSFLYDLQEAGIKVIDASWDEKEEKSIPAYVKFSTEKSAETFYSACKWLGGMDRHFFSCAVEIRQEGKKVLFDGADW